MLLFSHIIFLLNLISNFETGFFFFPGTLIFTVPSVRGTTTKCTERSASTFPLAAQMSARYRNGIGNVVLAAPLAVVNYCIFPDCSWGYLSLAISSQILLWHSGETKFVGAGDKELSEVIFMHLEKARICHFHLTDRKCYFYFFRFLAVDNGFKRYLFCEKYYFRIKSFWKELKIWFLSVEKRIIKLR